MKLLITALIVAASFTVSANECRAVGDKAEKIMNSRQSTSDVFKIIDKYKEDKGIVLDAFQQERVETMSHLSAAIHARSASARRMHQARLDDAKAKRNAIVDAFKMKYIMLCLNQ